MNKWLFHLIKWTMIFGTIALAILIMYLIDPEGFFEVSNMTKLFNK